MGDQTQSRRMGDLNGRPDAAHVSEDKSQVKVKHVTLEAPHQAR